MFLFLCVYMCLLALVCECLFLCVYMCLLALVPVCVRVRVGVGVVVCEFF